MKPFDFNSFLEQAPQSPGVYQMIGENQKILYVGKAKNLKSRLSSYPKNIDDMKVIQLVKKIHSITLTLTNTEDEALLIENQLIKSHQPHYNVLLKDDKSFKYLALTNHPFPRLMWYRGKKEPHSKYFGPYPHLGLGKEVIETLTKCFQLRTCTDSYFKNRKRPCLLYHMGRCSAPCVGFIDQANYEDDIKSFYDFLSGENNDPLKFLHNKMMQYSQQQCYEEAGKMRHAIQLLRTLQRSPQIETNPEHRVDIVAIQSPYVYHMMVFDGALQHAEFFIVQDKLEHADNEFIEQLLNRLYEGFDKIWYPQVVISNMTQLRCSVEGTVVLVRQAKSIQENRWMEMALASLLDNIKRHELRFDFFDKRFMALRSLLNLECGRIDCVDISHHQGEHVGGVMVVCTPAGFQRNSYKKYSIEHNERRLNNDVYSIYQTVLRHVKHCLQTQEFPSFILIDGGKTQLVAAQTALDELGVDLQLISIAKGLGRKPGLEKIYQFSKDKKDIHQIEVLPQDLGFLLMQQIRDEAHRFAITWQKKRQKQSSLSHPIDHLPGLRASKKQELLEMFGGWDGLTHVTYAQLIQVEGIGVKKAQAILKFLSKYNF